MSENIEGSRVGRPPGADAKTVEFGLRCIEMRDRLGHSVAEIAAAYNMSPGNVHRAIAIASRTQSPASAPSQDAPAAEPDDLPAKPRRLGAGTLARRALDAAQSSILLTHLQPQARWFWVQVVRAIHEYGADGVELRYERPGPFHSPDVLAQRCGSVAADLQTLVDFGLLVELPEGGVSMPAMFDLRPKPKAVRSRVRQPEAPDRRQTFMPHVVPGGRTDSSETPISMKPAVTETRPPPENPSTENGISLESFGPAPAAAAAAKSTDFKDLSSSSSKQERANDSSETPADSSETPAAVTQNPPNPLAPFIAELATTGRRGGKFSGHERETLRTWVSAGVPVEFARTAIVARLAKTRRTEGPKWLPSSMAWFKEPVLEAWAEERARSPAAANGHAEPAPPAAEEPDEPATDGDSPEARFSRVRRDLKREVGVIEFRIWLKAMTLVSVVDGEVKLAQGTRFLRDSARQNHGDRLLRLWRVHDPAVRRVEIVVAAPAPTRPAPAAA